MLINLCLGSIEVRKKNPFGPISTCDSLLKYKENISFLKQIVTGNEKWILYSNCIVEWASLVAQTVKSLPAVQETQVQSLGWEDPLE